MDPLLKLLEVPLNGISSLMHINCTAALVSCEVAEGALNPTDNGIIDEDIK